MINYTNVTKRKGFTIIEVMAVIVIIGILVAVLLGNFQQAREQSRNTAMKAAIKEMQLAIETYRAQYGFYPMLDDDLSAVISDGTTRRVNSRTFGAGYITGETDGSGFPPPLEPDFIPRLPMHTISKNPSCSIFYKTEDSNQPNFYKLVATGCAEGVTASTGTQSDDEFAYCPDSCSNCPYSPSDTEFYESYAVYSNGGQCI